MWKLLPLSILQCTLLCTGQTFLKLALQQMLPFGWNKEFWLSLLLNWQFLLSGICCGAAALLWMFILKYFPFSIAYPLVSFSYIFAMFVAIWVFKETVPVSRWIGCALIVCGCLLIAK